MQCQRTERRRDKRLQRDKRRLAEDDEPDPDLQTNYACFDDVGNSASIHVFGLNHLEVRAPWTRIELVTKTLYSTQCLIYCMQRSSRRGPYSFSVL